VWESFVAGFSVAYASGGAMAKSAGYPDTGLMTLTEVVDRLRVMTNITNPPVIANSETPWSLG
jgi:2-methylisocitrate lyase-like PEP mutase family enzyme